MYRDPSTDEGLRGMEALAMVTEFILDRGTLSFYRGRDGAVNCHYSKCGKPIKYLDRVVSKSVGSSKGEYRVLYHAECAEEAGII